MKRPLLLDDVKPKIHPVLDFDENTYYLGFLLDTMIESKITKYIFVLTEDGLKALDEVGVEFRYDTIPEFDTRISNYILRDSEKRKHPNAILDAFQYIKELFEHHIDYSEPETYDFMAIWSIGTYFFPLFYSYPYVHIHGLSGTGKTKNLETAAPICFNGLSSGNMSSPTLFRVVELWRPTLFIDETDALAKKNNRPDFRELLLNGNKKFGKAWRSIKKDEKATDYVPKPYDVFCPKMLGNIDGLEDVLGSRAIRITMWRSKSTKYAGDICPEDPIWQKARDLCYLAVINDWRDVKMSYEQVEETEIINRNWELWKPILAIAKLLGKETYDKMVTFANRRIKEMETLRATEAPEYKLVKALYRLCKEDGWHNLKDIKKFLMNEFEEGDGNWITSHWTSKAMERLGFKTVREYAGYKQYHVEVPFLLEVMERLGIVADDIKQLEDKKIPNFRDMMIDFIKSKKLPTHNEILLYFGGLGAKESDTEKLLERLSRDGIIYQPQPNRYSVI